MTVFRMSVGLGIAGAVAATLVDAETRVADIKAAKTDSSWIRWNGIGSCMVLLRCEVEEAGCVKFKYSEQPLFSLEHNQR
jgi:hypothetical protein